VVAVFAFFDFQFHVWTLAAHAETDTVLLLCAAVDVLAHFMAEDFDGCGLHGPTIKARFPVEGKGHFRHGGHESERKPHFLQKAQKSVSCSLFLRWIENQRHHSP
jgi:hypothetical protein